MTRSHLLDIAMALLESGEDTTGVCVACGDERGCVEPDAEGYECEGCGENKVMGAEQVLLCYA